MEIYFMWLTAMFIGYFLFDPDDGFTQWLAKTTVIVGLYVLLSWFANAF